MSAADPRSIAASIEERNGGDGNERRPTLVLLPGLGADRRLFGALEGAVDRLVVPPWPEPRARESLRDMAARLAASVPRSGRLYLGGASFGGMVALELAGLLRPGGVVLIGSCTSPSGVAVLARGLGLIASAMPASAFRPDRWMRPCVLRAFEPLTTEQQELLARMANATPPSFLKWGVGAILSWRPTPVDVPVHQIHGSDDRLIPLRRVRPQRIVPGGGHLLTLTHPREVRDFLARVLSGGAGGPQEGEAERNG